MTETDVDFNWNEPVLSENEKVLYPADTLDRCKYADFLHNYLANNASDNGYVLNLNAPWGSGKTYFINRWMESIKATHPVVYIDAWKQDYSDDPMLTVISSIVGTLNKHLPKGNEEVIEFHTKASRFFKSAAPLLTKGLIKKATGLNIDDVSIEEAPQLQDDNKDNYNLTAEAGAALAQCLINDHNEKLETVEHLRTSLKKTINAIPKEAGKPNNKPTFVFIDELDRCRPNYAVEMLEVIKHFFEIEGIVFVIATDTAQLQHAVKAVYGNDFDAQTYLGRFFKRRYSLNSLSRKEFVEQYLDAVEIQERWKQHCPLILESSHLTSLVYQVADSFNLSLRETEQLADKFIAVLNYTNKSFSTYLLLVLFVLRDKHYSLYERWVNATLLRYDDIVDELKLTEIEICAFEHFQEASFFAASNGVQADLFSFRFAEFLTISHINTQKMDINKLREASNQLHRHLEHNAGKIEQMKTNYQLKILHSQARKRDYINWVELAVSFDE